MTNPTPITDEELRELERLHEALEDPQWIMDERCGIAAVVSELCPNGYQGLHSDSSHVVLSVTGKRTDDGTGAWEIDQRKLNALRFSVAMRNSIDRLIARIRAAEGENGD